MSTGTTLKSAPAKGRWRKDKRTSAQEAAGDPSATNCGATGQTVPEKEKENAASRYAVRMMRGEFAMTDGKLNSDVFCALTGGSIYLPGFFCDSGDLSLFERLQADIERYADGAGGDGEAEGGDAETKKGKGLMEYSKHMKHENPDFSAAFQEITEKLAEYFDLRILATRLNFYRDGSDWKPFHHDSHAFGDKEEDFTAGASFGSSRELQFLHPPSGQTFSFPQKNGDVFAFTKELNRKFQHGVPRASGGRVGPRISIIVWGQRKSLNSRNGGSK
uniref:Fe2OG dioxygenase domain-containing protein n=1 Tax=Chromera velia CCMP2878 TaxID=1169474 RepID=A0A0G4HRR1_9ALVE|eukprot:Cvel_8131.t1-p1 / transcript=Cvel_8131.t1 / gene=Cvel_8131 / organism=Chromera_velia_CCMP2878 / gene_product=Uncharacterized protein R406, putative / transcript_product=Uncharacterized protein R406, putative / location=Cvel_scaffold442:43336-45917(+) / protein_length=274 / sequence_SO=supercontig / SO=protein_coding / is_pseudo=false